MWEHILHPAQAARAQPSVKHIIGRVLENFTMPAQITLQSVHRTNEVSEVYVLLQRDCPAVDTMVTDFAMYVVALLG
jgi:hypothetical protein